MPSAQINNFTEYDYYNLPEHTHAELIDGQIYYHAAPSRIHQKLLGELYALIHNYIRANNGTCEVYPAPFAVKLYEDRQTIVEPDISVICDRHKLTDRGCSGAPDWIIEIISPTNSSHDYIRKLNLYSDAGVREYWIADPLTEKILVYHLEQEAFKVFSYTFSDQIKVHIYDDFFIDFSKLNL